jgi:transposase
MAERVEVVGRRERRRRWSVEEKLRIVAETLDPSTTLSEVARRYDVAPNLLFTWRRMAQGRPARHDNATQLVPVRITEPETSAAPAVSPRKSTGQIEVGLPGGIRVKFKADVDAERLAAVLSVLRRG